MITVFLMIAAGLFILSVAQGAASIAPARVVEALTAPQPTTTDQIIWNIRLPRTLTGIFVGMNLALAGAILQAIMRNPLADPHIIGVSSGAGAAGIGGTGSMTSVASSTGGAGTASDACTRGI